MQNNPAKRLAAAVLEQALKDYKTNRGYKYDDSKKWFEAESRQPFGFYWCLEHSEVNPNLVRKYLKECDENNPYKNEKVAANSK